MNNHTPVVPSDISNSVRIFKLDGITKDSLIEVCNSLDKNHAGIDSAVLIDKNTSDYLMIIIEHLKRTSGYSISENDLENILIRSNGPSAYPIIKSLFGSRDFRSIIDDLAFGRCDLSDAGSMILA